MEVMMMMSSSDHHHDADTTCSRSRSSSPSASPPLVSTPPSPPPVQQVVASPCAACKILRRRCSADKCVLAPYFPPTDPLKFATAHKVFGASNIIKLLQELPEVQRADAVSSMVYEANARVRDPVYGSAGAICHLQKQVGQLQAELAKAQAEVLTLKSNQSHLLAMLCVNLTPPPISNNNNNNNNPTFTNNPPPPITNTYDILPPVHDQDYSELDSPMSDGFLNFYPDATNCTLISWDLL